MTETAFARAEQYLLEEVERVSRGGGQRLRNHVTLSRACKVSPVTMLRALRALRDRGVIGLTHGGAVLVPTGSVAVNSAQLAGERVGSDRLPGERERGWRWLASKLRADVLQGRFGRTGNLPGPKKLAVLYGANYRTTRKGLDHLVSEGILEPSGRTLRTVARVTPNQYNTLVVLHRGDSFGSPYTNPWRTKEWFWSLDAECSRANLRIKILTFHYVGTDLIGMDNLHSLIADRKEMGLIAGFVIRTVSLSPHVVSEALQLLLRTGKPIAFFDEIGGYELPRQCERSPLFRRFTAASSMRCGMHAAQFMLARGHRHCAYIGYSDRDPYSAVRYLGVRDGVEGAGIGGRLSRFSIDDQPGPPKASLPLPAFTVEEAVKALVPGLVESTRGRYSIRDRVTINLAEILQQSTGEQVLRFRIFPLLKSLRADGSVTAWICYNDEVALHCLDYLKLNGIRVPQDVSVMGFDDTFAALENDLTSYNFRMPAYALAIVQHVLDPRSGGAAGGAVEMDGFIRQRGTTGGASKK